MADVLFDSHLAKEMLDAFYITSGVACRLLALNGEVIHVNGIQIEECPFLKALPGTPPPCEGIHRLGMAQAERYGGRYIYTCPSGLTYFTSPILVNGSLAGALVAGPVLITDVDDVVDDLMAKRGVPAGGSRPVRQFLSKLPQMEPAQLSYLSTQLFSNAVYISDSTRLMLLRQNDTTQQSMIGDYIQRIKSTRQNIPYPISKEQELTNAISNGDKVTATSLLNEILGHIFFFTSDSEATNTRITELLVLLGRAAIYGGASTELIFDISHRYMQELRHLHTQEDVAQWLAAVLSRFTDLVFDLVDSKHKNIIRRAVNYMQANYTKDLTLGELADYVGYSHSHFSKVFKEEMHCGFRTYLNQLRVEHSKSLLLSGTTSIAEICSICGFDDQSYFCKVFKKLTGVTPDKFRKQSRRLNPTLERSGSVLSSL